MASSPLGDKRRPFEWDRTRLSVVAPVCVIVALAITCIVVAVLTSAQRADQVALAHEEQLFTKAIAEQAAGVLRQVESVATTAASVDNIRTSFNRDYVQQNVGRWLQNYFDHDYVFVADPQDHLIYARLGRSNIEPDLFASVRPSLDPMLDYLRGRTATAPTGTIRIAAAPGGLGKPRAHVALVQNFVGRPAIVAAVAVTAPSDGTDKTAPAVLVVRFIDEDVLTGIATRLQLHNLRQVADGDLPSGDFAYEVVDGHGLPISRFAWTPTRTGSEIVASIVPFITVAIGGFMLLVGLVLRYMRRTAATIAAGENRMRHLALHDPLCGLPNRIYFGERLESVINEVRRGEAGASVFYIDLDHFKDVNDTLGHPVGDELIRNVTLRLARTVTDQDLVARLGGDEFAVLLAGDLDANELQTVATRMRTALCAPYAINDQTIVIGASIGIAIVDQRVQSAADIMRYADMALYRAKNEGRNRACIYDAAMDADLSHRKHLENDLREALENDALHVVYQPLVNASGERVIGLEALARWTHPLRGEVSPAEFIPVAEHSGLIFDLGEWVLRRACHEGRQWPGITMAVNVSPMQFRRPQFVEMVERALADTGFDPTLLELEVTESTLLGNVDSAEAAMLRLKALGVRLALDDFGTGYSSLQYLRRFPFDKLKIDGSFVRSIEGGADAAAIIHAVVSLGRGLRMKVTAEGVETAEQHLFLRAAGVHSLQGYRFGRPVAPEQITLRISGVASAQPVLSDPMSLAG
ncbi:MAG: diguanylate cyclase [Xanthobacteraceae bacterium]|nr:diguanylate cyclase [Xanthobacteraceae bacterium]